MGTRPVVLVGVDGSDAACHALDWAVEEAARRGWGLQLVCAYTIPVTAGIAGEITTPLVDDDGVRMVAERCLEDAAGQAAAHPLCPQVTTRVVYGDAAGVLVDASAEAGLAVIGKRGRGGFASRLLGGVGSALPAHSACPTVVVPLAEQAPDAEPGVVVGVDGSPTGAHAADVAAEVAGRRGWPLTLLCAVPVSVPTLAWLPAALDPDPLAAEVRRELEAAAATVRAAHPDVEVRTELAHEAPGRALTQASCTASLVVVGARGHGGFAGLLLGSVSQAVLRHARCPVLVVPRLRAAAPAGTHRG